MVFVGSRKELLKISSDFENGWISFIRAFNRLENDEAQIKALFKQAEILRNEINRKRETLSDERIREVLSGLWTILENIWTQLHEMVENMPEMEEMEFSLRKKNVKTEIKKAKSEITLCADALEEYEKTKDQTPKQLSRRQFFQKAGSVTKKSLALALIGSLELTPMIYMGLLALSKDLPLKEDGLAILISYKTDQVWDTFLKPFGKLFVPAYVARLEIAFGQKANIVKTAATSNDLFDVLHDKSIQNIVIFGHGTWQSWVATDKEVFNSDLYYKKWQNDQKNGLFVRHTCGEEGTIRESSLSYTQKDFQALERECQLLQQELSSAKKETKFSVKYHKDSALGKNIPVIVLHFEAQPNTFFEQGIFDRSHFKKKKEVILAAFKMSFAGSPHYNDLLKKMITFFEDLREYILENQAFREERIAPFGTPHYPRDRIRGWDRISYPWDFMIDVFGDRKLDQLYAKK